MPSAATGPCQPASRRSPPRTAAPTRRPADPPTRRPADRRILLSGYAEFGAVQSAINLGAVYKFLSKPWDPEDLIRSLDEAFELYESR